MQVLYTQNITQDFTFLHLKIGGIQFSLLRNTCRSNPVELNFQNFKTMDENTKEDNLN